MTTATVPTTDIEQRFDGLAEFVENLGGRLVTCESHGFHFAAVILGDWDGCCVEQDRHQLLRATIAKIRNGLGPMIYAASAEECREHLTALGWHAENGGYLGRTYYIWARRGRLPRISADDTSLRDAWQSLLLSAVQVDPAISPLGREECLA